MASQPPSSVIAACRTVSRDSAGRAEPPGRAHPAVHGVHVGRPVDERHAAMAELRHVIEEQPHRAGLVHDHVVAVIRPPPVHVHVRDLGHPGGVLGVPQRGGQQQAVRAALLDQVTVGAGRLGVLPGLLHDHDHVAAIGGPLQRAALEPHPDRVAQQRDDERDGPGLAPLQRPGQRVGPVALLACRAEDPAVDLGPDRLGRVAVEHPGHGGHVHADRFGDVDQARPPGPGRGRAAPRSAAGLASGSAADTSRRVSPVSSDNSPPWSRLRPRSAVRHSARSRPVRGRPRRPRG